MAIALSLPLLLALLAFVSSCEVSDDEVIPESEMMASGKAEHYVGIWKVDGADVMEATLSFYPSGFAFDRMPVVYILEKVWPEKHFELKDGSGYMVPYENMASTSQNNIYKIGITSLDFKVVSDGKDMLAKIYVANSNDFNSFPWASYSKLTGTFSIMMNLADCKLSVEQDEGGKTSTEVRSAKMEIKFISREKTE